MKQWRIVHTESSRGWGGQEVRVFAELLWMREQGYWVALAADPTSAIARRAQEAGITFFPLRAQRYLLPLAVGELARWFSQNRVNLVNTHSSSDGWIGGLAARLAGVPLIIRSRHIEVDYPNRFSSRIAFGVVPHRVLTTSQRIADRLIAELGLRPERVECVATGVDLKRFRPDLLGKLREELKLSPDVPLVGMISVLRSWKGHATLLAAVKKLAETGLKFQVVIVGDGPGREELRAALAQEPLRSYVTLLGHRADVPDLLASLDLLVLPSFAHEGIPQIILQAQAMGRAVLATRVGGIPEVVEDGVTGLLVPPKEPEALAEKIALLLGDSPLRQKLGQAARKKIEQQYSLDAMGQRLLQIYGQS